MKTLLSLAIRPCYAPPAGAVPADMKKPAGEGGLGGINVGMASRHNWDRGWSVDRLVYVAVSLGKGRRQPKPRQGRQPKTPVRPMKRLSFGLMRREQT